MALTPNREVFISGKLPGKGRFPALAREHAARVTFEPAVIERQARRRRVGARVTTSRSNLQGREHPHGDPFPP